MDMYQLSRKQYYQLEKGVLETNSIGNFDEYAHEVV